MITTQKIVETLDRWCLEYDQRGARFRIEMMGELHYDDTHQQCWLLVIDGRKPTRLLNADHLEYAIAALASAIRHEHGRQRFAGRL